MESHVFLSYSRADWKFVDKLAASLQAAGIPFWRDTVDLIAGDSVWSRIAAGVDNAAYVVAVLSPSSVSSPWFARELELAMSRPDFNDRTVIIPLLHKSCEVPPYLRDKHYIDFTGRTFDRSFQRLVYAISGTARLLNKHHRPNERRAQGGVPTMLDDPQYVEALGSLPIFSILRTAATTKQYAGPIMTELHAMIVLSSHAQSAYDTFLSIAAFLKDITEQTPHSDELLSFVKGLIEDRGIELRLRKYILFWHSIAILPQLKSFEQRQRAMPDIFLPVDSDSLATKLVLEFWTQKAGTLGEFWRVASIDKRISILNYVSRVGRWRDNYKPPSKLAESSNASHLRKQLSSHLIGDTGDVGAALGSGPDEIHLALAEALAAARTGAGEAAAAVLSISRLQELKAKHGDAEVLQLLVALLSAPDIDAGSAIAFLGFIVVMFGADVLAFSPRILHCLLFPRLAPYSGEGTRECLVESLVALANAEETTDDRFFFALLIAVIKAVRSEILRGTVVHFISRIQAPQRHLDLLKDALVSAAEIRALDEILPKQ